MKAHIRLTADSLPEGRYERIGARAEMISTALHEAAVSPQFRLEMITGEAYSRYRAVVYWLLGEINKESPETQRAFRQAAASVPSSRYAPRQAVQALLISDAVAIFEAAKKPDQPCLESSPTTSTTAGSDAS